MPVIKVEDMEPGMILAADAVCLNGRVLLRAGATLSEQNLKIFRTWGLSEANIQGVDADAICDNKLSVVDARIGKETRRIR